MQSEWIYSIDSTDVGPVAYAVKHYKIDVEMTKVLDRISLLAQSNKSIYERLTGPRAFRLLELEPGQFDDSIKVTLTAFDDLATAPDYHAVSYCWGDVTDIVSDKCFCNGLAYKLTRSLHGALRRVRSTNGVVRLWADAICIDQSNDQERAQQVALMKVIFSRAERVYVWLGEGNSHTSETVKTLREVAEKSYAEYCKHKGRSASAALMDVWLSTTMYIPEDRSRANADKSDWQYWPKLMPMYSQPWFRRVWVIQEVQRCDDIEVLWGQERVSWEIVAFVAKWVAHSHTDGSLPHYATNAEEANMWRAAQNAHAVFLIQRQLRTCVDVPFLSVLRWSACFDASDPRDKIFAMLGYPAISEDRNRANKKTSRNAMSNVSLAIKVDYNTTYLTLLREIALQSIYVVGTLDILSYHWYVPGAQTSGLPRWVPRWDVQANANEFRPITFWRYSACGSTKCDTTFKDQLSLQGLVIGTITKKSSSFLYSRNHSTPYTTNSNEASLDAFSVGDLRIVASMLTSDLWTEQTTVLAAEKESTRRHDRPQEHFADFARSISMYASAAFTKFQHHDFYYVAVRETICTECLSYIDHGKNDPLTGEPPQYMYCNVCNEGDYTCCVKCLRPGMQCPNDVTHTNALLRRYSLGFRCHLSEEDLDEIRSAVADGDGRRFRHAQHYNTRSRVWFSTSRGDIGCGRRCIEVGDLVVVLFGARVPFVLRPQGKGIDRRYELIGDCYVHGMMDGEAIEMWQTGVLDVETFSLI